MAKRKRLVLKATVSTFASWFLLFQFIIAVPQAYCDHGVSFRSTPAMLSQISSRPNTTGLNQRFKAAEEAKRRLLLDIFTSQEQQLFGLIFTKGYHEDGITNAALRPLRQDFAISDETAITTERPSTESLFMRYKGSSYAANFRTLESLGFKDIPDFDEKTNMVSWVIEAMFGVKEAHDHAGYLQALSVMQGENFKSHTDWRNALWDFFFSTKDGYYEYPDRVKFITRQFFEKQYNAIRSLEAISVDALSINRQVFDDTIAWEKYARAAGVLYVYDAFRQPSRPIVFAKKSEADNFDIFQKMIRAAVDETGRILEKSDRNIDDRRTSEFVTRLKKSVYSYLYGKLPKELGFSFDFSPDNNMKKFEEELKAILNDLSGQDLVKFIILNATWPLEGIGPRRTYALESFQAWALYRSYNLIMTQWRLSTNPDLKEIAEADDLTALKRTFKITGYLNGFHGSSSEEVIIDLDNALTPNQRTEVMDSIIGMLPQIPKAKQENFIRVLYKEGAPLEESSLYIFYQQLLNHYLSAPDKAAAHFLGLHEQIQSDLVSLMLHLGHETLLQDLLQEIAKAKSLFGNDQYAGEILLASQSPRRTMLMAQFNISYQARSSQSKEPKPLLFKSDLQITTKAIALLKVIAALQNENGQEMPRVILTSDTLIYPTGGKTYGKPQSVEESKNWLTNDLLGVPQYVSSSIVAFDLKSGTLQISEDTAEIQFVSALEGDALKAVEDYAATAFEKGYAGGFGIQDETVINYLVDKFSGDPIAVVGLPVAITKKLLENVRVNVAEPNLREMFDQVWNNSANIRAWQILVENQRLDLPPVALKSA